jgi:hypothetical protein
MVVKPNLALDFRINDRAPPVEWFVTISATPIGVVVKGLSPRISTALANETRRVSVQ